MGDRARFTQGRVRVNRYGSAELIEALHAHVTFLLDAREAVQEIPEAKTRLNTRIEHARRVLEEAERTASEQGWAHGQPEQSVT